MLFPAALSGTSVLSWRRYSRIFYTLTNQTEPTTVVIEEYVMFTCNKLLLFDEKSDHGLLYMNDMLEEQIIQGRKATKYFHQTLFLEMYKMNMCKY